MKKNEIQKLRAEYEEIIKNQKERITALREENEALKQENAHLNEEKPAISAALLSAHESAMLVQQEAKQKADDMMQRVNAEYAKKAAKINQYEAQLSTLKRCMTRIIESIDDEINEAMGRPIVLRVGSVEQKDAAG